MNTKINKPEKKEKIDFQCCFNSDKFGSLDLLKQKSND